MANILILGKDLPDSTDFIKSFELKGHKIFTSLKSGSVANMDSDSVMTYSWNKASAISTRAFLIQAESRLISFDRIIIYFDALSFSEMFQNDRVDELTVAMENMIYGYQYAVGELLARFRQKTPECQIMFLIQTSPTKTNVAKIPGAVPCSVSVAAAQSAFIALAENSAYNFYELNCITPILARVDASNTLYRQDRGISEWACEFMDKVSSDKKRPTIKNCSSWVKAGSKSFGLGLF